MRNTNKSTKLSPVLYADIPEIPAHDYKSVTDLVTKMCPFDWALMLDALGVPA